MHDSDASWHEHKAVSLSECFSCPLLLLLHYYTQYSEQRHDEWPHFMHKVSAAERLHKGSATRREGKGQDWHAGFCFLSLPNVCVPNHSGVSDSLWPHGDSPGKNTGVGCHALLQGIIPTQGSNPGLPHCGWILYRLSHQGNPQILEWVACPFSRGTSWPWNWTRVSCIAGRSFTTVLV